MDNRNKIIIGIILIFTIGVIIVCALSVKDYDEEEKKNITEDALKFKKEYESENDALVEVNINVPNNVKYVTLDESINLMKEDKGVIYFGFKLCPWCRNMVDNLVNVSNSLEEDFYYLDITDIRSKYEVVNKKLKKTIEGEKGYYELLKIMDDKLEDYIITDNDKEYKTKEKRLYAPTVVAFNKGKITDIHVGTIPEQNSPDEMLTGEQDEKLNNELKDVFNSIKNSCNNSGC